jgi:hypothetical protein
LVRADWYDFNRKNKDRTKAFEDMCRVLFLRDRKKTAYEYSYNINEAGLEFQPVEDKDEKKWYGAQCKFFISESNDTKYRQVRKSLKKAVKYFKGKLDVIYIYTNAELSHVCTDEEILSGSDTPRIDIARIAKKNNIEIKWLQADNILDMVKESSNLDLYKMYFSDSREWEFIRDAISIEDNTFLQSDEFLNLSFTNGRTVEDLISNLTKDKFAVILGAAGTGKSVAMKKLYKDFSDKFNAFYFEKPKKDECVCIPVFIRLRECINGNIENLIRERLTDYDLSYRNERNKYFYLFDGLDEVPYYDASKILHSIKQLSKRNDVKGLVISSRSDSSNLSYFRQEFLWNEYIFDKLKFNDIEKYFDSKNNDIKKKKLKNLENGKLISEIDDIFSANILWENIEDVDFTTSKIEIIELAIFYWIRTYSKLRELSLLQPKQEKICEICQEISFQMQKKLSYSISLDKAQEIIKQNFGVKSPSDINTIIEALTDLFFEASYYEGTKTNMSFRHKRFQEFFLYQKIEKEYYDRPEILRELKLFSNRDFMINIFLRTSLKRSELNRNTYKCLSLRLLEGYLGSYYISKEYRDDLIGRNKSYMYVEPHYSYSNTFLYLLSTYKEQELEFLLSNDNLNIGDAITEENFPDFAEVYHRTNGVDISPFVKQKFSIETVKVNHENIGRLCYYLYNIKNEGMNDIYKKLLSESKLTDSNVKHMDYVANDNKLEHSFIRTSLEFELKYLSTLVENMDIYMLEVLSYNLVEHQYINILLQKTDEAIEFREKLIYRIEDKDEKYYTNTLAIYTLLSDEDKYQEKLKKAFNEANQRNYPSWSRHIELHILLAILQKDNCRYKLSEFELGVEITRIAYNNYHDTRKILDEWLEVIKPYNFIYNGWLRYYHSHMLGVFISKLNFDPLQVKKFLRELLNYESIIYIQTVLFTIYKSNKNLFEKVANKGLLDKILKDTLRDDIDEYNSQSESIFQLAVMYDSVDIDKKYELLIYGIDNSMVRPAYRAEQLVSRALPECLYLAHQSFWYDADIMEKKCHQLYNVLETINKTSDNAGSMEHLKWVIEKCNIESEFLQRYLYNVSAYSPYSDGEIFEYDMDCINIENIEEYYACRVNDAPYKSIQFWRDLVEIEYSLDSKLTKLYDTFSKMNYPSYFGNEFVQYCHFPTAVLYEKEETREAIVQYIINQGGTYGIYNMIRVFFIIGEMNEGIHYIEHLIKFSELLISNSNYVYEKEGNIIEAIRGEWNVDESQNEAISNLNPNIKISWNDYDEREAFQEDWATCHPDKSAYRYDYKLFVDGNIRRRFSLVWVDGFRAVLPIPKLGTNIVRREEYLMSKIFNRNIEELNSYMRRSNLIVQ